MLPLSERRAPFVIDEAKFATQRLVTYALLLIFTGVVTTVFLGNDQAERSTVLQTVINFTMLAIGFWLGSSKGAADNRDQLNKIISAQADVPNPATAIPAHDVKVQAEGDVTVETKPKETP